MKSSEFKILVIGFLLGIIFILLVLKIMNIPLLMENQVLTEDDKELMSEFDEGFVPESTGSADLEQF